MLIRSVRVTDSGRSIPDRAPRDRRGSHDQDWLPQVGMGRSRDWRAGTPHAFAESRGRAGPRHHPRVAWGESPGRARPSPTAWPYSDLPGGRAATSADATDEPTAGRSAYGLTGNWLGLRDALFDEGIDLRTNLSQFYQGVTSGGLRQTLPLRSQVRLLRNHRGREAPRLGGPVRQPPRREPIRAEHQPRRRLPGPGQLRPRVPQADGERLGLDQHADRAVPGPQPRRHLRQAQRRRRRQHPPVPGRQRHQSLHE